MCTIVWKSHDSHFNSDLNLPRRWWSFALAFSRIGMNALCHQHRRCQTPNKSICWNHLFRRLSINYFLIFLGFYLAYFFIQWMDFKLAFGWAISPFTIRRCSSTWIATVSVSHAHFLGPPIPHECFGVELSA